MASSELAVFALGLCIALKIWWLVQLLNAKKLWTRLNQLLHSWLSPAYQTWDLSDTTEKVAEFKSPTSRWVDENVYQLECRAIFSKQWLFVTHASRFQQPGDYRTFEIAGYSFLVILGKDEKLRAFHNVCRHRAYAVTKKECGRSTVLGCRYHGWSYNSQGKLIKAPEFENLPGFDKDLNGLWEVATEVRQSLVFVNLDAGKPLALELRDVENKLADWEASEMRCISDWKFEAAFNWKLLGALKNEDTQQGSWTQNIPQWVMPKQEEVQMLHTTLIRKLASGRILTVKAHPKSAKTSTVECSIFSKHPKNPRQMEELKMRIYHDIERLESMQQRLSVGQEPLSSLAPGIIKQEEIDTFLKEHMEAEKLAGYQIHPAARKEVFTSEGKEDDDFCRRLNDSNSICGANSKGLLDW